VATSCLNGVGLDHEKELAASEQPLLTSSTIATVVTERVGRRARFVSADDDFVQGRVSRALRRVVSNDVGSLRRLRREEQ